MTDLYGCSDHNCIYGHKGGMGTNGGCRCEKELQRMGMEGKKAARQIRLLRAEVERLKSEYHEALQMAANQAGTIKTQIEEIERLRKDAERYRWLRNNASTEDLFGIEFWLYDTVEEIDAAIDAAMRGEE